MYKRPTCYHLSHPLLDKEYDRVQPIVLRTGQSESLRLTLDGWIVIQGNPLLKIMLATHEAIFLKATAMKSSHHTDEYTANVLTKETENVDPSRVEDLITDNVSNTKAVR